MCREIEIMIDQSRAEDRIMLLIEQVCAKMQKFSSAEEIADDLAM